MATGRAKPAEDRPNQGIFEFLRNDDAASDAERAGVAQPLEIGEMEAKINSWRGLVAMDCMVVQALDTKILGKVRFVESG